VTTNSDAYFARFLMATFKEHHGDFPVERGQAMELAAGQMSTAIDAVEQAVEALEEAKA